jgi:hypothetical protein
VLPGAPRSRIARVVGVSGSLASVRRIDLEVAYPADSPLDVRPTFRAWSHSPGGTSQPVQFALPGSEQFEFVVAITDSRGVENILRIRLGAAAPVGVYLLPLTPGQWSRPRSFDPGSGRDGRPSVLVELQA